MDFAASRYFDLRSTEPNPMVVKYNASVVKIYNGTGSLVRFETKNIFFYYEHRSIQRWRCSEVVGLAPLS
jgi:hypothetical protein